MAITVKPKTLATGGPYTPTGELGPTEWNDGHEIEMASQRVLGRVATGAGDAEELKGMWVEVSRATASNSTTIDFTGIDSTADEWMFVIISARMASDGYLCLRTSTDGGSTYDSGSSDYVHQMIRSHGSPFVTGTNYIDAYGYVTFSQYHESSGSLGINSCIRLINPSAADFASMFIETNYLTDTASTYEIDRGMILRAAAADVNAVRFLGDAQDIASGTFVLYKRLK
jgi:hypothetical protein